MGIDERSDPERRDAAKYLKTLSTMFEGDWHLALASPTAVRAGPASRRPGRTDDF
jgi:hypothetical protein